MWSSKYLILLCGEYPLLNEFVLKDHESNENLGSLTFVNTFNAQASTQGLKMMLPESVELWRACNSRPENTRFSFLTSQRFDFQKVRKLVIDDCQPDELQRIIRLAPNLRDIFSFVYLCRTWPLSLLRSCCVELSDQLSDYERLDIDLTLSDNETYA